MFEIHGLDKLQRELSDAQRAIDEISGELGSVRFDPHDAASIEQAIQGMEQLIDDRLSAYSNNSIISSIADGMKEKYRQDIIDKAGEASLLEDKDE